MLLKMAVPFYAAAVPIWEPGGSSTPVNNGGRVAGRAYVRFVAQEAIVNAHALGRLQAVRGDKVGADLARGEQLERVTAIYAIAVLHWTDRGA